MVKFASKQDARESRLRELVNDGARLLPMSVKQYHKLIADGFFSDDDRFELLDGYVVRTNRQAAGGDEMSVGLAHSKAVMALAKVAPAVRRAGATLVTQSPLTCPPDGEPEPDAYIMVGDPSRLERHPHGGEVTCVVEVSDGSLRRDRTTKLRVYASAGMPVYVIINLVDKVAEVFREPISKNGIYGKSEVFGKGDALALPCGGRKTVKVKLSTLL